MKIVIVGTSGCGKTTLARRIADEVEAPFFDMDDLYWLPGWVERTKEEAEVLFREVVDRDRWVLAGNGSNYRELVWSRADLIIWIDLPLHLLLWRALKRSLRRIWTGEPCCNGNIETLSRLFSRNSIFTWILGSYWRRKRNYTATLPLTGKGVRVTTTSCCIRSLLSQIQDKPSLL